jgi:hypothetical protein
VANTRCECSGTHHKVLEDVYPGGLWSESSPYPYRVDVVDVHPCHCAEPDVELIEEELAAVRAYDPPPADDDPDYPQAGR